MTRVIAENVEIIVNSLENVDFLGYCHLDIRPDGSVWAAIDTILYQSPDYQLAGFVKNMQPEYAHTQVWLFKHELTTVYCTLTVDE